MLDESKAYCTPNVSKEKKPCDKPKLPPKPLPKPKYANMPVTKPDAKARHQLPKREYSIPDTKVKHTSECQYASLDESSRDTKINQYASLVISQPPPIPPKSKVPKKIPPTY